LSYKEKSAKEWREAQVADNELAPYLLYLEKQLLPDNKQLRKRIQGEADKLRVVDGILYRYDKLNPKDEVKTLRRWVPASFRKDVLFEMHDSILAGAHMGRDKTFVKLREKYFFHNMASYVRLYCRTCHVCQRTKRPHPVHHKLPAGTIEVNKPYQMLCIDLWDPCYTSEMGNVKVLTIIDAFSKFAHAIPLRDEKSETIAFALMLLFASWPTPEVIHSDNGANSISEAMQILKKTYGVDHSTTTIYHPQGNAFAERIHQFFRNAITSYAAFPPYDWDMILAIVIRVYNNTLHSSLDELAPAELHYGRKLGLNAHQIMSIEDLIKSTNKQGFVYRLNLALGRAEEQVLKHLDEKSEKRRILNENDVSLNSARNKFNLQPGDSVMLKIHSINDDFGSSKLRLRQEGPFIISRVLHEGRVIRVINPLTGVEDRVPRSYTDVTKYYTRGDTDIPVDSMSSDQEDADDNFHDPIPTDTNDKDYLPEAEVQLESLEGNRSHDAAHENSIIVNKDNVPLYVKPVTRADTRNAQARANHNVVSGDNSKEVRKKKSLDDQIMSKIDLIPDDWVDPLEKLIVALPKVAKAKVTDAKSKAKSASKGKS
jgi:hypothetical protein